MPVVKGGWVPAEEEGGEWQEGGGDVVGGWKDGRARGECGVNVYLCWGVCWDVSCFGAGGGRVVFGLCEAAVDEGYGSVGRGGGGEIAGVVEEENENGRMKRMLGR